VVNFASAKIDGCDRPLTLCAAVIADTGLQQGQACTAHSAAQTPGISWPRADLTSAATTATLPASNADIGMTMAKLLDLKIDPRGRLRAEY